MRKQYHVHLTPEQRSEATAILARGQAAALTYRHARILLEADAAPRRRVRTDGQVADAVRREPAHGGPRAGTLRPRRLCRGRAGPPPPRRGSRSCSAAQEARLIALACTPPPAGRARWSVRLLAERVVELERAASAQPRTGAHHAQKNRLKPWRRKRWLIPPQANAAFVAAMEDVLAVYARPSIRRGRWSVSMRPARISKPTPVLPSPPFLARPRARTATTPAKAAAICFWPVPRIWAGARSPSPNTARPSTSPMPCATLVDQQFPAAERHRAGAGSAQHPHPGRALSGLPPAEAWRILARLEWHYTPTHGSWLNMAELEWSVLSRQCLDAAHPRCGHLGSRGRGLGGGTQRRALHHLLALHQGGGPHPLALALPMSSIGHVHHVGVLSPQAKNLVSRNRPFQPEILHFVQDDTCCVARVTPARVAPGDARWRGHGR